MKLQLKPQVHIQENQGRSHLLDGETGRYFELNHVGVFVVQCLQKQVLSLEELSPKVAEHFNAPTQKVEKDMEAFVAQLINQGLLQHVRA